MSCSELQCAAVCCSVLHFVGIVQCLLQYVAVSCSVLQCRGVALCFKCVV